MKSEGLHDAPMGRRPPRLVLAADLNAEGLISGFWAIANPRKLTAPFHAVFRW